MPVTPASPWRNPPRISLASFERVLRRGNAGVLAERPAIEYYNAIVSRGVDPLYILAKFNHESSLGTAGVARTTHSWGNTRTPNFGAVPIGSTPGASGTFPIWRDWLDGLRSTVGRLVSPEWVYFERESIEEIYIHPSGKVWAPAGDMNNPNGYLRSVIDFMNANEDVVMQAEIPGFLWVPETCGEYGYDPFGSHGRNGVEIDRLIIHYTDGNDSLDWLTGCHGNSVHFLTEKDGTPRAQMVALSDAAWGAGNKEYNLRGVQLEIERTALEARSWPDALIENVARIAADICKACPGILPDREHIIGHGDVPGQDHTDPGGFFPWDHFIDLVQRQLNPAPPFNPFQDPVTGHFIHEDFHSTFDTSRWGCHLPTYDACVQVWGRPVEGAFLETQPDGKVLLVQYLERAVFQKFEDGRVEGRLLGAAEFGRLYPTGRTPD